MAEKRKVKVDKDGSLTGIQGKVLYNIIMDFLVEYLEDGVYRGELVKIAELEEVGKIMVRRVCIKSKKKKGDVKDLLNDIQVEFYHTEDDKEEDEKDRTMPSEMDLDTESQGIDWSESNEYLYMLLPPPPTAGALDEDTVGCLPKARADPNLRDIVNHGHMREDEARNYFHQLINAVDYCHSRGVHHRDLKPENLLLDTSGNLKVSDFGLSALSQQVRDDGLLHTSCGTPNYVAPKVLNDRGYDGATADLWSCGVILSNVVQLYKKISTAEFTFPPWMSFGATKLLYPNTITRITVSEVLEDEWFKKDYKPPVFDEKEDINLDDVEAVSKDSEEHHVTERTEERPVAMNAFELSKGLNLVNLFDQEIKRETMFTSRSPAIEMIKKNYKFYRNLSTCLEVLRMWKTEDDMQGKKASFL